MHIILGILAVIGIVSGFLTEAAATTVFQEIIGGITMLGGFICLSGAAIVDAVNSFAKRWSKIQEHSILREERLQESAQQMQKSADEMIASINRLRMEQEQTNRMLEWLGEIQQLKKPDSN